MLTKITYKNFCQWKFVSFHKSMDERISRIRDPMHSVLLLKKTYDMMMFYYALISWEILPQDTICYTKLNIIYDTIQTLIISLLIWHLPTFSWKILTNDQGKQKSPKENVKCYKRDHKIIVTRKKNS